MGALTKFLQREFSRRPPIGWACRSEVRLLPLDLEQLLGYSPRVDVLFEREEPKRRLWIEFEVSRADPVANLSIHPRGPQFVLPPAWYA